MLSMPLRFRPRRLVRLRPARSPLLLVLALAAGLVSCQADPVPDALEGLGATSHPGAVVSDVPQLLRHAPDAPPLQWSTVTFVAESGTPCVVEIPYASDSDGEGGDVFIRFELGAESLLADPDGTPFESGDAVTISITVDPDPASGPRGHLCATFSPPGLQFDPLQPARLTLAYVHADPDVDGDGEAELDATGISMWRQGAPGTAWERLIDAAQTGDQAVEAELDSFSRYALAF